MTQAGAPTIGLRDRFRSIEIDTRLLGMFGVLAVIWIGFHIMSNGNFITPRNLWNLSVQSASIGIMATGMVLIIVSRNIDLSVGAQLGFVGYTMAMLQTVWIPISLGMGLDQPFTWILTVVFGLAVGALIGLIQGFVVAYGGVPSFIVTLGGLLVWRGLIFQYAQGQTLAPLDSTFRLLGGGPAGSIGEVGSWAIGLVAIAGIIYTLFANRRRRRRYGFVFRPKWAELALGVIGTLAVLAAVWVVNSYGWPEQLAHDLYDRLGLPWPPGGVFLPVGIAYPVIIMLAVGLLMTYLTTRRRFGRNVFAIGGNPDAAVLSGINVRRTIMLTFGLMGVLAAISAVVQTARLNAAVTGLGVSNELDVISAAVIGGTSLSGGIGTIPGAILGAVVMQSLRSGMVILKFDSPVQDIVVGIVLVTAVGFDALLRRRST
ncbi:MAG: D-xylose transport system permease protein [Chloroflexota bacterium]|jgi:D-xylose transport system permease protein|nr:D-xylose transport system permease protein [Chloroflexota bacterium]